MIALSFVAPSRLWLLLAVVALVAVYVVVYLVRRPQYAVRFTNLALLDVVAPKRPGWRRHVAAAAFALGVAGLVVSLAKPTHAVQVPVERATVILAVDVSLSMEADDVQPSRLAAAQASAQAFLETVPDTINVGLVKFSGSATVLVPPTTDHARVRSAIDGLQLGEGTGIGEAIFASLDALSSLPEASNADEKVPATIILLSDGETTVGRPNQEGVDAAKEAGVPVSTIAFGTDRGEVLIEDHPQPVPVVQTCDDVEPDLAPIACPALREIADDTGGVFFDAEDQGELTAAYEDLGSSIGFETQQQDVGQWFVGGALVALTAAGALSLFWFSRLP